jgi:purine-binding chemotaxis protein CheW
MNTDEFLIFRLRQLQYGITVSCVREIFPLPEINPVPEAPGDIIGLLNWRGKVLPVMHLDRRLGQPMQPCRLSDSVIVIEWEGIQVGMIVNQVEDVISLEKQLIDHDITYGRENYVNTAFLAGVAKIGAEMLLLLNTDALIRLADEVAILIWESELQAREAQAGQPNSLGSILDVELDNHLSVNQGTKSLRSQAQTSISPSLADFYSSYCPEATVGERQIFAQRAAELKQAHGDETQVGTKPIAVLELAGEYFGIELELVKEFINLPKIHPIPCCPTHILGNLNLRGEVVTLVDLKSTLHLNTAQLQEPKIVITQIGNTVTGIAIDDIHDVLYIREAEMSGIRDNESHWIQGITPYESKVVSILNLPQLIQSDLLSINEVA